jgi:hypothetical protein
LGAAGAYREPAARSTADAELFLLLFFADYGLTLLLWLVILALPLIRAAEIPEGAR